jgi:hypothetical protein
MVYGPGSFGFDVCVSSQILGKYLSDPRIISVVRGDKRHAETFCEWPLLPAQTGKRVQCTAAPSFLVQLLISPKDSDEGDQIGPLECFVEL